MDAHGPNTQCTCTVLTGGTQSNPYPALIRRKILFYTVQNLDAINIKLDICTAQKLELRVLDLNKKFPNFFWVPTLDDCERFFASFLFGHVQTLKDWFNGRPFTSPDMQCVVFHSCCVIQEFTLQQKKSICAIDTVAISFPWAGPRLSNLIQCWQKTAFVYRNLQLYFQSDSSFPRVSQETLQRYSTKSRKTMNVT